MKTNKSRQVLEHLEKNKSITTWEAIKLYGATRLSAIIFNLREEGYHIENEWQEEIDRNGNKTRFVKYILLTDRELQDRTKAMLDRNMSHIPRID